MQHHPGIDFIFIFDYSCEHDRGRENGLNVTNTKIGYGGGKRYIHPTNTKQEVGHLLPHKQIIDKGDDQNMAFQEVGNGKLWTIPQERVDTKFSNYFDLQLKDNTKAKLLGDIKNDDVDMSVVKGKMLGDLQDISCENLISITNRTRKEGAKVWMGETRGILKVLWEHGFMYTSKNICTYYILHRQQDNYSNTTLDTGLRELIRN